MAEVQQSAKNWVYKLWSNFRKVFLNVKLQRLWICHHIVQGTQSKNTTGCILSSGPQALKTGTILFWKTAALAQEYFQVSLSEKAKCEHEPETPPSSLRQSSFKMSCKVENCSVVRHLKMRNSFWKSWTACPGLVEESGYTDKCNKEDPGPLNC